MQLYIWRGRDRKAQMVDLTSMVLMKIYPREFEILLKNLQIYLQKIPNFIVSPKLEQMLLHLTKILGISVQRNAGLRHQYQPNVMSGIKGTIMVILHLLRLEITCTLPCLAPFILHGKWSAPPPKLLEQSETMKLFCRDELKFTEKRNTKFQAWWFKGPLKFENIVRGNLNQIHSMMGKMALFLQLE